MNFFIVAGLSVSMADSSAFFSSSLTTTTTTHPSSFNYTWVSENTAECNCNVTDSLENISVCVNAVDKARCGYTIVASWTGNSDDLVFDSVFASSEQQVFRLPDAMLSHGLTIPTAKVGVRTDLSVTIETPLPMYYCGVLAGTYFGTTDPVATVDPLEKGEYYELDPDGTDISYSFTTKEANYILITSDNKCDLHHGVVISGGTVDLLEYTFRID